MNEDPTRLMDYGDEPPRRRRPPHDQPHGNLRLVVLIMGVVIFGLLIGLLASCGGGSTKTVKVTHTVTEEVTVPAKETSAEREEKEENGEATESSENGEPEEGAEEPAEETGGIEEGAIEGPTQEELEIQEAIEIEEAAAAEAAEGGVEEGTIEEPEGGGVEP
jgi:hypothetical protein